MLSVVMCLMYVVCCVGGWGVGGVPLGCLCRACKVLAVRDGCLANTKTESYVGEG